MQNAYKLASLAVRARLEKQSQLARLNALRQEHVTVLRGEHDHVEQILDLLRVKYRLDPRPDDFSNAQILFANCSGHRRTNYFAFVQQFCHRGGWLVSTDWCLESLIEPCFDHVIRAKPGSRTGDEVVGIEAATDSMWADVVVPGCEPQWWLESSSYPIDILDEELVKVEASSHEMLDRFDAPAVAVSFDWGVGRVQHVLSHFWMQRSRTSVRPKHNESCVVFLQEGLNFTPNEASSLLRQAKLNSSDVSFAELQTAVTSTELVVKSLLGATRDLTTDYSLTNPFRWVVDVLSAARTW